MTAEIEDDYLPLDPDDLRLDFYINGVGGGIGHLVHLPTGLVVDGQPFERAGKERERKRMLEEMTRRVAEASKASKLRDANG